MKNLEVLKAKRPLSFMALLLLLGCATVGTTNSKCFSELTREGKEELIDTVWGSKPLSPKQREIVILGLNDKDPEVRDYTVLNGSIWLDNEDEFALLAKSMFDTDQHVCCRASFLLEVYMAENPELIDHGFHSLGETWSWREMYIEYLKRTQEDGSYEYERDGKKEGLPYSGCRLENEKIETIAKREGKYCIERVDRK